jgi:c-di-GMP-binding flagellar brake protein YcgR
MKSVPRQDSRRSPRAAAGIPFSYRMVVNGIAVPESRRGTLIDIGYHGALAEIEHAISQASKLQLRFELPLVGERFRDLGARAVKVMKKKGRTRVGMEFGQMTAQQEAAIQRYVQLLIQP